MPRHYVIPKGIADYMNEKADQTKAILSSLSPQQDRKVDQAIKENLDDLAASEIFRAMNYDVAHSGSAAFKNSKASTNQEE
jgi:hypothetical protein